VYEDEPKFDYTTKYKQAYSEDLSNIYVLLFNNI